MNTFFIILTVISLILAFSAGFLIGSFIQRKKNNSNIDFLYSYDKGWSDCMNYYQQNYEITPIDEMLNDFSKELNE